LSILKYKKLSILDYWKQFSDVAVLASIDLIGKRAEYVRSGVDYDVLETNYQTIKDYVSFKIDSTLTVYNSFNLMALQRRWIEDLGLSPDDFNIRIAMFPPKIMCCSVLPWPIKELVIRDINNHIAWLSTFNNPDSLVTQWKEVLQFINSDDQSHLLGEFLRVNDDKDRIRNEKFEDVFPEFQTLRSYV